MFFEYTVGALKSLYVTYWVWQTVHETLPPGLASRRQLQILVLIL